MVKSTDSPLEAAKRGKDTSMWLSIESVKKRDRHSYLRWQYWCIIGYRKTKFKDD